MEPTIYLFFKGDCLEAMTHYCDVLGGEVIGIMLNGDAPNPESRMPGGDDMVMNMMIRLGNTTMMASDNSPEMYEQPQGFRVTLAPTSREEFEKIYAGLSHNARSVELAPNETFFAERFAMFIDRFGTPWMLILEGNRKTA